jgi:hypothetical protein
MNLIIQVLNKEEYHVQVKLEKNDETTTSLLRYERKTVFL